MGRKIVYTIDGNEVTLKTIRNKAKDFILTGSLGEYIESKDLLKLTGIKGYTLYNWRNSGKIRAKQINKHWFYSKSDLLKLL